MIAASCCQVGVQDKGPTFQCGAVCLLQCGFLFISSSARLLWAPGNGQTRSSLDLPSLLVSFLSSWAAPLCHVTTCSGNNASFGHIASVFTAPPPHPYFWKGGTLPEIILWFSYQGREVGFLYVPVFARVYKSFFLDEHTLVAVTAVLCQTLTFSQLPDEGSGVIQYSDKERKACRVPGARPDHTAGYQPELGSAP